MTHYLNLIYNITINEYLVIYLIVQISKHKLEKEMVGLSIYYYCFILLTCIYRNNSLKLKLINRPLF